MSFWLQVGPRKTLISILKVLQSHLWVARLKGQGLSWSKMTSQSIRCLLNITHQQLLILMAGLHTQNYLTATARLIPSLLIAISLDRVSLGPVLQQEKYHLKLFMKKAMRKSRAVFLLKASNLKESMKKDHWRWRLARLVHLLKLLWLKNKWHWAGTRKIKPWTSHKRKKKLKKS